MSKAIDRLKAAMDRYDNQLPPGTEEIELLASVALAARAVIREDDRRKQAIDRAIERLKNIDASESEDAWWVQDDINAVVRELEES